MILDSSGIGQGSKCKTPHPWSHELEVEALQQTTPDPSFDFSLFPSFDDRVGWEIWYYQQMERAFRNEVESYSSLQGSAIPRCYGSGTLILPNRALFPHVLLLQYIPDAIDLEDIVIEPDKSFIASLVKTVSAFGALGVAHDDLNRSNILFSPRNAPIRAVVIDFGHSFFREDESDQEWDEIVEGSDDVGTIKRMLGSKGWKVET
jgi:hypothetical protein